MRFKKKKRVDLEKGKELFYKYNGSTFGLEHDLGDEYSNCNVPKEIEELWLVDIKKILYNQVETTTGYERVGHIYNLLHISRPEDNVKLLVDIIQNSQMDTFSLIRLCEELKRQQKHITSQDIKNSIKQLLKQQVNKMMSQPIVIDQNYKTDFHMRDYDFSDENIKRRISQLLT